MLHVKKRDPFVRQPSSEEMAKIGVPVAEFPMAAMTRRRSSAETTSTGLRPLSMASSRAPIRGDAESGVEPPRSRLRTVLEDGTLTAAARAGEAWRWAQPKARDWAVPASLGALGLWCVVLTIYVAKGRADVQDLLDMPPCEDLGLTRFSQGPGLLIER